MLKKEDIKAVATLLKIKEADLEAAIADEKEVDLKIDAKLQTFDETELQTVKSNSYKEGKKAGVEMEVDELKKELGYDFQGKTIKGLIDFNKKKVLEDAKIEPEKKVTELQEKLTTVQNSYKQLETKLAEKDNEVATTKTKSEVFKHIPSFGDEGPAFDQEDVYNMMRTKGFEFKIEEGKVVAYKDGKQVQDKLSNPTDVKEVVNGFLMEKKLITEEKVIAGRGDKTHKQTSKFATLSELKKHYQEQGKNLLGSEFSEAVQKAAKENPEFAMDK